MTEIYSSAFLFATVRIVTSFTVKSAAATANRTKGVI